MTETDLVERIRQYASFLENRIRDRQEEQKALERINIVTANLTGKELVAYRAAKETLYALCPEAVYTRLSDVKPKTE